MSKYKKQAVVFGLGAAMLLFLGCATGEHVVSPKFNEINPDEVAVVDITGDIRGDAPKNQVDDFFTMELMEKNYQVIERERVNSVLAEQDFQRSDRTTDQEAAQIGKILNVPAVAMLDASVDGEKVSLTGRMVDVETGEVLWIGTGRGGSGRTLATVFGAITGGLIGSQIGGGAVEEPLQPSQAASWEVLPEMPLRRKQHVLCKNPYRKWSRNYPNVNVHLLPLKFLLFVFSTMFSQCV